MNDECMLFASLKYILQHEISDWKTKACYWKVIELLTTPSGASKFSTFVNELNLTDSSNILDENMTQVKSSLIETIVKWIDFKFEQKKIIMNNNSRYEFVCIGSLINNSNNVNKLVANMLKIFPQNTEQQHRKLMKYLVQLNPMSNIDRQKTKYLDLHVLHTDNVNKLNPNWPKCFFV